MNSSAARFTLTLATASSPTCCAQTYDEQMGGMEGLAVSGHGSGHLNNPAGYDQGLDNVHWVRFWLPTEVWGMKMSHSHRPNLMLPG